MLNPILFYSTNLKSPPIPFHEALLKGLAPDGGLYMPQTIPVFGSDEMKSFSQMQYYEIAFAIIKKFISSNLIDNQELLSIVKDAYSFEVPLEKVYERKYIMRLDQGPTASFKDFAARMMARLMQYFLKKDNKKLLILTATSGDTGSAIANAFYGLDAIKVIVLFPEKEVTERQRKQMTTLGKNIEIIAVSGTFDNCQALVKKAFTDKDLSHIPLSSANSINIGRLIPQSIYYFYSFAQLSENNKHDPAIFSVPSGNFGNFMAGLLAKAMGLPVKKFIVATNENDEVPLFQKTGSYTTISPSKNCISSAMNVGHPSNFARVIAFFGGIMDEKGTILNQPDLQEFSKAIFCISINENQTIKTIEQAYHDYKLLLEPHGAIGWAGLQAYLEQHCDKNIDGNQLCIALETAHPAKFPEHLRKIVAVDPDLPTSMHGLDSKKESYIFMENDYKELKNHLRKYR